MVPCSCEWARRSKNSCAPSRAKPLRTQLYPRLLTRRRPSPLAPRLSPLASALRSVISCVAKLLSDMASEVIRGIEGGQTESPVGALAGVPVQSMPPPPHAANRRAAAPAAAGFAAPANAPSTAAAAPLSHAPAHVQTAHRTAGNDVWSRAQAIGMNTMRRLSFFSSPGAPTPGSAGRGVHYSARAYAQNHNPYAPYAPALSRSQSYPAPFASPVPPASGAESAPVAVAISVTVAAGPATSGPAAALTTVRVSAPRDMSWLLVLKRVEARLLVAGVMPLQHAVAGLRAADGSTVVSAEDLREGEAFEADLVAVGSEGAAAGLGSCGPLGEGGAAGLHPGAPSSACAPRTASSGGASETAASSDGEQQHPPEPLVDGGAPVPAVLFQSPPSSTGSGPAALRKRKARLEGRARVEGLT